MAETVLARPNHYETLGLQPSASGAEIAQAFARELRRPRAFGDLGQISIAYETLRDPIKRRAYDASLGLKRQGEALRTSGASFLYPAMTAPAPNLKQPAAELPPQPTPQIAPEPPRPAPASEALLNRLSQSFAAPTAEDAPPKHDPVTSDVPSPTIAPRAPEPEIDPATLAQVEAIRRRVARSDGRPLAWQRPAAIAGALIAFVGLLGAWAGWEAGNDLDQQPGAAKAAVPPAKPAARPQPQDAPVGAAEGVPVRDTAVRVTTPPKKEGTASAPATAGTEEAAIEPQSGTDPLAPVDQVAATEQTAAVAANLPLPNRVIASTIAKIGYPCGQVTSSESAAGGAPGTFKVTCASGHSYQATQVRGRYRFRRWSGP